MYTRRQNAESTIKQNYAQQSFVQVLLDPTAKSPT